MPAPRKLVVLVLVAALGLAACGSSGSSKTASSTKPVTVRLGYFPNITHAPAIVGDRGGYFQTRLGTNALKVSSFNAGPEEVSALFAGALDMGFVGPNPAINAYAQSSGAAIRIVSGATSGGASLVVRKGITSAKDLVGKKIATPQLGNTQDVALRAWLKSQGESADQSGGGDVSIKPQANGDALTAFIAGSIDGAWVPEPWATRFVQEGGAHVLVDEATLWPQGQFVTTQLIVRTEFLKAHPDVVKDVLEGLADAVALTKSDPAKAKALTNDGIKAVTGKALSSAVLEASWTHLTFTLDPIASSLTKSAADAEAAGLLKKVDLTGIYDLTLLNQVLAGLGQPAVKGF